MSSDDAVIEGYDEGDRRGDLFAIVGFATVALLWLAGIVWNFRDLFDFSQLTAPKNWVYWIAIVGTGLGAVASSSKLGTRPKRSWRDSASLFCWALAFISSFVCLAVSALHL